MDPMSLFSKVINKANQGLDASTDNYVKNGAQWGNPITATQSGFNSYLQAVRPLNDSLEQSAGPIVKDLPIYPDANRAKQRQQGVLQMIQKVLGGIQGFRENNEKIGDASWKYWTGKPQSKDSKMIQNMAMGASLGGDMSRVAPAVGTVEQLAEQAGGFTPGSRAAFDTALLTKDVPMLKQLLPNIPAEYKARFATEIAKVLGG